MNPKSQKLMTIKVGVSHLGLLLCLVATTTSSWYEPEPPPPKKNLVVEFAEGC